MYLFYIYNIIILLEKFGTNSSAPKQWKALLESGNVNQEPGIACMRLPALPSTALQVPKNENANIIKKFDSYVS